MPKPSPSPSGPDIAFLPDQSYPHANIVEHMLSKSTDGKHLSLNDFSYFNGLRRAECKQSNGQYSLSHSFFHKFFGIVFQNIVPRVWTDEGNTFIGSGNAAFMYSLFGGNVEDLRVWLAEERMPPKWEPKVRWSYGNTIVVSRSLVLRL